MGHLCSIESFYSNIASANILNPCHRVDRYGHIRLLRSFINSYDHFSTVTIIAPGQLRSYRRCRVCNFMTIMRKFHKPIFRKQSMAAKSRLMMPLYCVQIQQYRVAYKRHNRPCPNPLSTTSAILYDRNCYDRNCFPTVKFRDYRPFSSVSHCPRRTQSKQGTVQQESAASALPAAIVVTATVAAAVAVAAAAAAAVAAAVGSQRQHCGHHHCGEEAQSSSRLGPSLCIPEIRLQWGPDQMPSKMTYTCIYTATATANCH